MKNSREMNHAMNLENLKKRYDATRANLLLVVLFTAINLFLCFTGEGTYFLFSAFVPYFIADLGMLMCGLYPPEIYQGELAGLQTFDESFLTAFIVAAAIPLVIYFFCWLFSGKGRRAGLVVALILFLLDTALMFLIQGFEAAGIIDIVFHVYVIVILISAIILGGKLKKLMREEE